MNRQALNLKVRPALAGDVDNILDLLCAYAEKRVLLPRTREDILEKLKNFKVGEADGKFICCFALRDYGDSLFEIRSLAVLPEYVGSGVGSLLVNGVLEYLRAEKAPCKVFALTYRANFFGRLGFRIVGKEMFPGKIWSDCAVCPKAAHCDETAVLKEIK